MKKQDNVITEEKIYRRICPSCNKEIIHKDKYQCIKGVKLNKVCGYCSRQSIGSKNKGRKRDEEFKINLSQKMKNHSSIVGNKERGEKLKEKLLGRDVSSWHKGSQQTENSCITCNKIYLVIPSRKNSSFCCNKCKEEYYFEKGLWRARFNPKACSIIDNYGKENGYNFQHALNGGEIRLKELKYWLDGYDREKNIVIEYNESFHYKKGKLIEKDIKRMNEIIDFLKCKFIVIDYKNNIKIYG